jgi:protein CWC15
LFWWAAYTNQLRRQPGQGGDAETEPRDLRAELLAAEAAHFAKTKGITEPTATSSSVAPKRLLETTTAEDGSEVEDADAKRRRVLEETREIDADSDGADSESSEDSDDDEDETAELMRELEKIKRERAEQKAKEVRTSLASEDLQWVLTVVQEAEKAAEEQGKREEDIALGNPLLNPRAFNVQRRWDDDVIFKNQARGTEQKGKKEFVNVCIRLAYPTTINTHYFPGPITIRLPQAIYGEFSYPSSFTRQHAKASKSAEQCVASNVPHFVLRNNALYELS